MKILLLLLLPGLFADVHGQQATAKKNPVTVYLGAKTRVTPIYLKRLHEGFEIGFPNNMEQPDYHLSGPGLLISEKKALGRKLEFSLHQVIRYDFLYQRMPMDLVLPPDFSYSIKRKWIIDLEAELSHRFPRRKSVLLVSLGAGLNGLNTGFQETRRFYQSPTSYTEKETRKNFLFPFLSTGFGWQKKKLLAGMKLGYCWDNPTVFASPFLYPELSVGYRLFNGK
ncbi:MAG TPA: hypothetical protein PLL23_07585 [Chitinophagaceae bacterium]|nr:hypothetical protein [Chitinophagaceae bacterium]